MRFFVRPSLYFFLLALGANASADGEILKKLDSIFQKQSLTMNVTKTSKVALLGKERHSKGKLWLESGRLRMELEGEGEGKNLLVANKKTLWVVTQPSAEFKDSPAQVVKGDLSTKRGRSQSMLSLLTQGGFLKFFIVTGEMKQTDGTLVFLSPKKNQVDITRAQMRISPDGTQLRMLRYWDSLNNETEMDFSDIKTEAKLDAKLFDYTPPANASVVEP